MADVASALTDAANPQGCPKNMPRHDPEISKGWGQIATPLSIARNGGPHELEEKSGRKVVSGANFLTLTQAARKQNNLAPGRIHDARERAELDAQAVRFVDIDHKNAAGGVAPAGRQVQRTRAYFTPNTFARSSAASIPRMNVSLSLG